jgi:hypothetical protein
MALPESYRPKWVMNKVGSRNCAQPNRPIFIFFLGGMVGTFGFFFLGFLICSHQVPNVFLNMFSIITPRFIPYVLPSIVWTLGTYIAGSILEFYIFFNVWSEYFNIGESPKFQNFFLWWTNKKDSLPKKKNEKTERISKHPD